MGVGEDVASGVSGWDINAENGKKSGYDVDLRAYPVDAAGLNHCRGINDARNVIFVDGD